MNATQKTEIQKVLSRAHHDIKHGIGYNFKYAVLYDNNDNEVIIKLDDTEKVVKIKNIFTFI